MLADGKLKFLDNIVLLDKLFDQLTGTIKSRDIADALSRLLMFRNTVPDDISAREANWQRNPFARILLQRGVPAADVADLLGDDEDTQPWPPASRRLKRFANLASFKK